MLVLCVGICQAPFSASKYMQTLVKHVRPYTETFRTKIW